MSFGLCAALVAIVTAQAPAPAQPAAPAPAPASASEKASSILVLDVAGIADVPEAQGLSPLIATLVEERTELSVTPASMVRDRLSLASEKLEAGCDAASCMAEVAGAIGARFVLFSRYSRAGELRLLRMEAFDDVEQRTVSVVTVRAESMGAMFEELPRAVADLVARSDGSLPPRLTASPVVKAPGFLERPGNVFITGGVAGIVAGLAAGAGWVAVSGVTAARADDVDDAVAAWQAAPDGDTAFDVLAARRALDVQNVFQTMASPLLLVTAGGVLGGAATIMIGVVEKSQAKEEGE